MAYNPFKFFDDLFFLFGLGSLIYLALMALKGVLEFWDETGPGIARTFYYFRYWLARKRIKPDYIDGESWWADDEPQDDGQGIRAVDSVGHGSGGRPTEVRHNHHPKAIGPGNRPNASRYFRPRS